MGHGQFWCDYLVKKEKTATYRREPGKRGPAKCPDIVAFDSAGLMYLIECKGTTTGSDYTTGSKKHLKPLKTRELGKAKIERRLTASWRLRFSWNFAGRRPWVTDQFNASAFDQKISVEFDDEAKVAQRLATGVYIAKYNSSEGSRLRIADPPPRRREAEPVCLKPAIRKLSRVLR